jgi:hypothetical protein
MPKCALCSRQIKAYEHYWLIEKSTYCRECGVKKRRDNKNNTGSAICNIANDTSDQKVIKGKGEMYEQC